MKKVLSLLLAVLMMFSIMSVVATAARDEKLGVELEFNLGGCTLKYDTRQYVDGEGITVIGPKDTMIRSFILAYPESYTGTEPYFTAGKKVTLPEIEAPDKFVAKGWRATINGATTTYSTSYNGFTIPEGVDRIVFTAVEEPDTTREEVLEMITNILKTIYRIISGLFTGSMGFEEAIDEIRAMF